MSDLYDEGELKVLPIKELRPNPYQPRHVFDEEALEELAQSIRIHGVLQPIIVRQSQIKGYEIIAGERRLRASQLAQQQTIPAIVTVMSDAQMMQLAIIENLQRDDLTPIDEARAYQQLMVELHMTQQEVADKMGKSRPYIANYLRLLQLPDDLQQAIDDGALSVGHARTLLSVKSPEEQCILAKQVMDEQWSVRQLEAYLEHKKTIIKENKPSIDEKKLLYQELERQLSDKFDTMVTIKGKKAGTIEISFMDERDLTHILDCLDIHLD